MFVSANFSHIRLERQMRKKSRRLIIALATFLYSNNKGSGTMKVEKLLRESPVNEQVSQKLNELIKGISYGTVTIVIQDGKIIQIEKNEKFRMR